MLALAADENFNNLIVRGLLRRRVDLNLVRIQDIGLSGAPDPEVLEWAASENRLLLTHDISTMTHYASSRIEAGENMPGIIECPCDISIGSALEDILLLVECSNDDEWQGQILYLPL